MDRSVPTVSLLPALPYVEKAVGEFARAAFHVDRGEREFAAALVIGLDDAPLRSHFAAMAVEWNRRNAAATSPFTAGTVARAQRVRMRMPTAALERSVYDRDGWHCRWCGTPVLSLRAVKRMANELPSVFGYSRANAGCHGLVLAATSSLDHVIPHSHGGTNDEQNLVTACWPCQFGRGNDLIERLGISDPRLRPPVVTEWDGCQRFR